MRTRNVFATMLPLVAYLPIFAGINDVAVVDCGLFVTESS